MHSNREHVFGDEAGIREGKRMARIREGRKD